jgi:CTP synthase
VNIALVGKYVELPDAYKSIVESFIHAGAVNECKVKLQYIAAESVNDQNVQDKLSEMDGVLVAPGFGERGLDGKLAAIKYIRENNIPFFGICLGMQCSVIEFGRNVLGLKDANSAEMNADTPHPVINLMEDQKNITNMGGTMRLGAYDCDIKKGTKAYGIYGKTRISERHRHRYEFNNAYLEQYEAAGMIASGINPTSGLVEIVELKNHPFFVAGQFHPELKSTVANPHPLFVSFVAAALSNKKNKIQKQETIK